MAALQLNLAQQLFDLILAWYRDMQLILLGGNRNLLIHTDYEEAIEQAVQRGESLPLEELIEIIKEARLSLERSTSIALCFENLFLKLMTPRSKN